MKKITIITGLACMATIGSIFGTWVFGKYPETEHKQLELGVILDETFVEFGGGVEVEFEELCNLKVGPRFDEVGSIGSGYADVIAGVPYLYPDYITTEEQWNSFDPIFKFNVTIKENFSPNATNYILHGTMVCNVRFEKETGGLSDYFDLSALRIEQSGIFSFSYLCNSFISAAQAKEGVNIKNEDDLNKLISATEGERLLFELSIVGEYQ